MNMSTLLSDLARRGIQLEAHGDKLRFFPPSALTPDLLERLKAHKPEVMEYLQDLDAERQAICWYETAPAEEVDEALQVALAGWSFKSDSGAAPGADICPWCNSTLGDDEDSTGRWCGACRRLVWWYATPDRIVNVKLLTLDFPDLDPLNPHATLEAIRRLPKPAVVPPNDCPHCGSWDWWQNLCGDWRCRVCHPTDVSDRVRQQAAEQRKHRDRNSKVRRKPLESRKKKAIMKSGPTNRANDSGT
jgi:TubC N-terminal docking domain